MKKIITILLTLLLLLGLCGCCDETETTLAENQYHITEELGNRTVTYVYHPSHNVILSKTDYNKTTDITTETIYYYESSGYGMTLTGSSVTVYDRSGNIIDSRGN